MERTYTILIGGKAGDGVKKAAQVIALQAQKHGYHVWQQDDYQSLIKGGHNYSSVSFSAAEVHCAYTRADMLVSFDKRSLISHLTDATSTAVHFYNSDAFTEEVDGSVCPLIGLPLGSLMKQIYTKPNNVSMAAIALFFVWMGWDQTSLAETIRSAFKRDIEENTSYAVAVWKLGREAYSGQEIAPPRLATTAAGKFVSGNQAIALGAWAAGLDFYYAYPMTPASSILHYLALKQKTHKVYAIHAESELAAANMAIGSVFAGAKTAIGSSGGGFSLMQEAFSLAGMVEAPLLCVLSSRPGPATGVSTYTAQEDLAFALAQGHGEFARVVASPDSHSRAFTLAAELLSLAWEFQSPVILLTEKHLSESSCDVPAPNLLEYISADDVPMEATDTDAYQRYAITESGISPLLFPGSDKHGEDTVIKWNSHEHLPSGLRTDSAASMVSMKDKRSRKGNALLLATQRYQRMAVYGETGTPVYAYGSTVLELREAQKYCRVPFRIIALIYLLPLPVADLACFANEAALVVEHSTSGYLAQYLRHNLNQNIKQTITRYDGRPFDPLELAALLEGALHA